jgi:hypothetical protein
MERRYAARIRSGFGALIDLPPIDSLDIPDEYGLMDPELIALLKVGVEAHILASKTKLPVLVPGSGPLPGVRGPHPG